MLATGVGRGRIKRAQRVIAAGAAVALATTGLTLVTAPPAAASNPACTPTQTIDGAYVVLTFDDTSAACDWTVPSGVTSVHVLAVGGGGGGGALIGGGGGGGGVVDDTSVTVTPGAPVTVTVGAGGVGAKSSDVNTLDAVATSGDNSSFGNVVVAIGGGHGASQALQAAGLGGSGGGGGYPSGGTPDTKTGAAGTAGQGFAGGSYINQAGSNIGAGGGGGASAVGGDASGTTNQNAKAGNGGAGRASIVTGFSITYGGGGGGSFSNSSATTPAAGVGGSGGGGNGFLQNGCSTSCVAQSGVDGLGGGGGGSAALNTARTNSTGGDGGDGIVIIRYFSSALVPSCDVGYQALNFDVAKTRRITGNGKRVGDKVIYEDVSTLCSGLDAVVTTSAAVDAVVTNFDEKNIMKHGGTTSDFLAMANILRPDGYAEFTFDFYQAGTYGTPSQTPVILRNVQVTGIDIDAWQFNSFSQLNSFTLASNTYLRTVPSPITTFPADVKFQSDRRATVDNPVSQAVATYGQIETFSVRFGTAIKQRGAFYGVAFRPLGWGKSTPVATGPATYTVGYDGNGADSGTVPSTQSGILGVQITAATNSGTLEREGFVFAGWSMDDSTGTGPIIEVGDPYFIPQDGGTLFAVWLPEPVTLSYNSNGGTGSVASATITPDDTTTVPSGSGFTKTGYVFTGWNTLADGSGTGYSPGDAYTIGAQNATLYAQWTPQNYDLTYSANGGSPNAVVSATAGTNITVSSTEPTRTGFWFNGWSTTDDSTGSLYPAGSTFIMPSADDTLFAVWVPDTFNLAYNPNGGASTLIDDSVTFGSTITLPGDDSITRAGYTFTGWNSAADGSGTDYAAGASLTMPASNTVIYAKWQAKENALTYNGAKGVRVPNSQRVATDDTTTLAIREPIRGGWAFSGWNTQLNGSGTSYAPGGVLRMPASDLSLYAQWIAQPQRMRYLPNAGLDIVTNMPADDTSLAGSMYTIDDSIPIRDGYVFDGWRQLYGRVLSPGARTWTPGWGRDFVALWTQNVFTLSYNLDGGSGTLPTDDTALFGDDLTLKSASGFTRPGYTFRGWASSPGDTFGQDPGELITMPAQDLTMYAAWDANPNTLAYSANGGASPPAAETLLTDDTTQVAAPGSMTRSGYWFSGWSTSPVISVALSSQSVSSNSTATTVAPGTTWVMGTSDDTLYAQWVPNIYNLTFNANGGVSTLTDDSVPFGSATNLPTDDSVTRAGFTLASWNTIADGSGTSYNTGASYTMPSSNTILYAQWTPAVQTLYYDDQGGTAGPADDTALTGDPITVSFDEPLRTGHIFAGWNRDAAGSGAWVSSNTTYLMPPNDDTLYAQWIAKAYQLVYEGNEGDNPPATTSVTYQATATVAGAGSMSRDGYTFSGWNTRADGTGTSYAVGATFSMPDSSLTLYAQWTAQPQTLTYDANGGTGAPGSQTANTDDTVTVSGMIPTRPTFAFVGWSTLPNGTGVAAAGSEDLIMPAGGLTLYAQWVGIPFDFIYDANGGTGGPGTIPELAGNPVTISSSVPTRTDFAFTGWNTSANGSGTSYAAGDVLTMPAANTALYAMWESTVPPAPVAASSPRNVVASPLNSSVRVTWRSPANAGSFPVTSYRATAVPSSQSCLVNAPTTTCVITGLTNGETYVIEVEALNGVGWSAPGRSNSVTPGGVAPGPGVVDLPEALAPGESVVLVDGAVDAGASVAPNATNDGLEITGSGWSAAVGGVDAQGQPISLDADGELVLDPGTQIEMSGSGYLPDSSIDVYLDPPVATTGAAVRAAQATVFVGSVQIDAGGNASGRVTVPTEIAPGAHVLQITAYTSDSRVLAVNVGTQMSSWIVLEKGTRKAQGRSDRIRAMGMSGGLEPGTRLTTWIRYSNKKKFIRGKASIRVQDDGSFRWTRKIRANRGLAAYVSFEDTKSNRVYWRKVR